MNHQEIANRVAEEKLRGQIALMRRLYSTEGFCKYWFDQLPNYNTYLECYAAVELQHQELFGVMKYSNYAAFSKAKAKIFKKP